MVVEIISIILSSVLSTIAVVVSIISINKQTKSQNINATIQLFDKRFEIYNFMIDAWYIVGYFEGGLDKAKIQKHCYAEIISFVNHVDLTPDIISRIQTAYINCNKYERMQELLFSGQVANYLDKFLSNFSTYISGIYHKRIVDKKTTEKAYIEIIKLHKTQNLDMEELMKFINLSDIKRLDI